MLSNITDNQYVQQNCFRIMKKTFQYIWLLHPKPLLLHPLSRGKDITNEMMEQMVKRVKFPVKYLILFLIRERERRASYIFFTSSGFG